MPLCMKMGNGIVLNPTGGVNMFLLLTNVVYVYKLVILHLKIPHMNLPQHLHHLNFQMLLDFIDDASEYFSKNQVTFG